MILLLLSILFIYMRKVHIHEKSICTINPLWGRGGGGCGRFPGGSFRRGAQFSAGVGGGEGRIS